MAMVAVVLPLSDDPSYSYNVALEGNSYNLKFEYNERAQLYFLSLSDADEDLIVGGEALVPNYPILLDYAIPLLSGFIWMEEISDIIFQPYKQFPDKLSQYYTLSYSYDDGE
jgi:hypothetical protein